MKTLTFDTYPEVFLEDGETENEDYDITVKVFEVPYDFAIDYIYSNYGMTYDEFMNWYTWDTTLAMYEHAMLKNAVISEYVDGR